MALNSSWPLLGRVWKLHVTHNELHVRCAKLSNEWWFITKISNDGIIHRFTDIYDRHMRCGDDGKIREINEPNSN